MRRFDLLNEYTSVYVPNPGPAAGKRPRRATARNNRLFSIAAMAVALTGVTLLIL